MATREDKAAVVDSVKANFERATAVVFVDYSGVRVPQVTELRNRFREAGVEYKVVKNRLIKKAIESRGGVEDAALWKSLKGMTGVAWSYEDPSAAAKIIKAFRKEHEDNERLTVKCGLLDTQVLSAVQVETQLASLPGKDELRASLLAQLMAPAQNLVRQLQAPAQNLGYVFDAIRRKMEEAG